MARHDIIIDKFTSKMKKAFYKAWKDRGIYQILIGDWNKGAKVIVAELKEIVDKQFTTLLIESIEETINSNDYPKWMEKWKTEDLANKVMQGFDEVSGRGKIPFADKEMMDLMYDAFAITKARQKQLRFEKGIITDDMKVLDKYFFPKVDLKNLPDAKIPFNIDSWEELRIEIQDKSNVITFYKLLDNKTIIGKFSTDGKKVKIVGKLIQFLEECATSQRRGTFHYSQRKHKSRLDIILRDLFNIEAESIISVEGKKNCYKPLFQISHYDKDGSSRYGHQHSNNTKKPNDKDLGIFTMDEDKDGYLYEEQ